MGVAFIADLGPRFNPRPARPNRYIAPVIFASRPGDAVAIVAPSSPFDERPTRRHRLARAPLPGRVSPLDVRERRDSSRGRPRRTAELQRAFDGDAHAVIAARGGYGLSRIAHRVDWAQI